MADEFTVIAMVFVVGAIIAPMIIFAARYKKVPPNKAMVVYGRKMLPRHKKGYMIISGGGKFLLPIVEAYSTLNLNVRELTIDMDVVDLSSEGSKKKIPFKATVLYKISSEPNRVDVAAELLLDKSPKDVDQMAKSMIEGTVSTVLRYSHGNDFERDWDSLTTFVIYNVNGELANLGLEIRSFKVHAYGSGG